MPAVGVTPLGLLLEAGEHALVVNGPQGRTWREQVHVTERAPVRRSFAEPLPAAHDEARSPQEHEAMGDESTAAALPAARAPQRPHGDSPHHDGRPAFKPAADTKLERLYVLDENELSIIDPVSLASSTYRRLEPSWLAGTAFLASPAAR